MKEYINKTNIILAIVLLLILTTIAGYIASVNSINKELEAKVLERTDIEILSKYTMDSKSRTTEVMNNIKTAEANLIYLREQYELSVLTTRCTDKQIDRLLNSLEYNIDYCKNAENLPQFKTKK